MPTVINGLPAHVLLIHAVVVLVPLAALMLVASAVWPAARARLGVLTPIVALIALVLVPVTTHAGEYLEDHLGFSNALIRRHAELGDTLLPWAIGLFVVAAAVWVLGRRFELTWSSGGSRSTERKESAESLGFSDSSVLTERPATKTVLPVWVTAIVAVVSIAVAVGTLITIYRIGDSGAHAVWNGVVKK
jgi:hypothetical protein